MRHTPLAACLIAFTVFNLGCFGLMTPSSVELCKKEARCSGDNSYVEQCKEEARSGQEQAKEMGCLSEYNALATCSKNNTSCNDGYLELDSFDACDTKFDAFTRCVTGGFDFDM